MIMDIVIIAILVLVGVLLLALEVALIPGIGVTGVLGALSMIGAVASAFNFMPLAGWLTLAIVSLAIVLLILWAVYGKSIDKVALKKNIDSTVQNPDTTTLAVGDEGVTVTRLALVGEADFGGRLVEVTSASGLLEEGTKVCVTRIAGGTIFVKSKTAV